MSRCIINFNVYCRCWTITMFDNMSRTGPPPSQPPPPQKVLRFDKGYLKTLPGILKIVALVKINTILYFFKIWFIYQIQIKKFLTLCQKTNTHLAVPGSKVLIRLVVKLLRISSIKNMVTSQLLL